MAISTKTNSTALSYLSIITNKTVEMIAMKIYRFVEVATHSHRHKETGGVLKVLRGDRGVIYMNREGCEWQVEWVAMLGHIFSDRTEVLALQSKLMYP